MTRGHMRDLMPQHGGQLVIRVDDVEQTGEDADIAVWQSERIRLVLLEENETIAVPMRRWRHDTGQPGADTGDHLSLRAVANLLKLFSQFGKCLLGRQ